MADMLLLLHRVSHASDFSAFLEYYSKMKKLGCETFRIETVHMKRLY